MGKQIHCYVVKSGFECSCFIVSALVDMYSNCNLLSAASKLFDQYFSWDGLALWNSMLSGYIVNEKNKAALCLLSQIHSSGVCIDSYTFSSAVKVCLNLLNLRLGLQVHGLIVTCGYESDYVVGSILIDLYAKLGNVKNALKLFHRLPNKDIVAWSGLIMGCAKMGLNSLAFSLAWSGLKPNEVTFLGVLSACRHAGWVEEARTMFKFMKSEYGMEPHLEHYYCVIDLLGQAGRFKEAEALIANMPFEPDKTIWCSMLKAYEAHKNIEMVSFIDERLLATSAVDPSIYVMLSNAYATLGMWDSSSKMRKAGKDLGIKEAGINWIEISS